ncbi:MAG: acylphosphatase [Hyphomicrobiales bacterium]
MSELETRTVRVRISGRVQGVWFRGWAAQTAEALGLAGWVRNRRDGTVEALFSGEEAMIDQMIAACHIGPSHADVEEVDVTTEPDFEETGFEQLSTV